MPGKHVFTGFPRVWADLRSFPAYTGLRRPGRFYGILREKTVDLKRIGQFIGQSKIGVWPVFMRPAGI